MRVAQLAQSKKPTTLMVLVEDLHGPLVEPAFHATPKVLEMVAAVERGKAPVPTLPVDPGKRYVVFPTADLTMEEVLFRWHVVKLGAFSSCPAIIAPMPGGFGSTLDRINRRTQAELGAIRVLPNPALEGDIEGAPEGTPAEGPVQPEEEEEEELEEEEEELDPFAGEGDDLPEEEDPL